MKKETLEEAAERYIAEDNNNRYYNDFIAGAKWQQEKHKELFNQETLEKVAKELFLNGYECGVESQERSYSEEDLRKAIQETIILMRYKATEFREHENTVIEQFKKK